MVAPATGRAGPMRNAKDSVEVSRSVAARRAGAGGSTETTLAISGRGGWSFRTQFLKLPKTRIASPRRDLAPGRGAARERRLRGQKSVNEPVQAVAVSPTGRSWEEGRRFLELNACNFRRRGSVLLAEILRSVAARRAGAGGTTETTLAGAEVPKASSASRRRFAR